MRQPTIRIAMGVALRSLALPVSHGEGRAPHLVSGGAKKG
jgi:hypothetical protein